MVGIRGPLEFDRTVQKQKKAMLEHGHVFTVNRTRLVIGVTEV